MSLINDALKRAHHNQPPSAPVAGAPLVAVPDIAGGRKGGTGWILPVLVVALVGASGFFFWKWRQAGTVATVRPVEQQVLVEQPAPVMAAVPATSEPVVVAEPAPASRVAESIAAGPVLVEPVRSQQPGPAATPVISTPVPVEPVAIAAAPAPLKLQAILFRLRNPTAIINGKTLSVGQSVSGAKLLDIQRNHVVVERDGQRDTLELP